MARDRRARGGAVLNTVIVGRGRIGSLLARALPEAGIVFRGDPVPPADATWLCVGEDDLPQVWESVSAESRAGCLLVQNGLLTPWRERHAALGATQGVLYVAVPARDGVAQAAGESVFSGPLASEAVQVWRALGLAAREAPSAESWARTQASKLAWVCVFGVLCARTGLTVGDVLDGEAALVDELLAELVPVLAAALGASLDVVGLSGDVRAYARTVAGWRAGLKALRWRNGALLAAAERHGLPLGLHERLLRDAGVDTDAASRSAAALLYSRA